MNERFSLSASLCALSVNEGKFVSHHDNSQWQLLALDPKELGALEFNLDGPATLSFFERTADLLAKVPEGSEYQFIVRRSKLSSDAAEPDAPLAFETRFYLVERLSAKLESFVSKALMEADLELTPLAPAEYASLENTFFGEATNALSVPDIIWEANHLRLGTRYAKILSLTEAPAATWPACLTALLEAPHEYLASFKTSVPKAASIRRALESRRRISHALSIHSSLELRNIESNANLSSAEEQLERIAIGKEALHTLSVGVVLIDADLDQLNERCANLEREVTSNANAGLFCENLGALAVYRSHIPGNKHSPYRELPLLSKNLTHLLPLVFDRNITQEATSLSLVSRSGERSNLNLFSRENLNFNAFICGASGSGKSFLTNSLISAFMSDCPQGSSYIFDVGGSYRRLTQVNGGEVINFTPQRANAFIKNCLRKLHFSQTGFCKTFLRMLCGEGAHFTHSHMVALEDLLQEAEGAPFFIKTLVLEAVERKNAIFDDIALWLKPFERLDWNEGLGFSINWSTRVAAFDFKELESDPLLQRLTILVLTDTIWQRLKNRTHEKTLIVFDEVWKFFKECQGFIEEMYRTLRKYGAGIVSITQSLSDYGDAAFAKLVIANSYTRILLQGGANASLLQEALDLSDSDIARCLSVASSKGQYSEFFVHTPAFTQIYRLYPSARLYALANTEHALIKEQEKI